MKCLLAIALLAGVCLAQTSSQDSGPTTIGPTVPKKTTKPANTQAPKPAPTDSSDDSAMPNEPPSSGPGWHDGADTTSDPGTPGESSSKDTKINIPPPSGSAEPEPGVPEVKPWDPHKADKNIEVGDYYFNQKNYRAAESRYREALEWKPGDAIATYKLGEVMEKEGNLTQARQNYEAYLKILPEGPLAEKAKKALQRIEKAKSSS